MRKKRQNYFTLIPNHIIMDKTLTGQAKAIYMILKSYTNKDNNSCYPSLQTICDLTGWSKNTTKKYVDELISKNLVQVAARTGTSNLYKLINAQYTHYDYNTASNKSQSVLLDVIDKMLHMPVTDKITTNNYTLTAEQANKIAYKYINDIDLKQEVQAKLTNALMQQHIKDLKKYATSLLINTVVKW